MIMRNLAGNVVQNMGLCNAVGSVCSDPSHDGPEVAERTAIHGAQCAAREGEFAGAVMREERIGVLEEGHNYEPVIHPERHPWLAVFQIDGRSYQR